jgi:NADH:ubiquinone oxidoreductase subunit 5 (subunit L)/multisubunit Na+/H+ antiporter MnhA subunit
MAAAWGQSLMWVGTVTMAVGVMYAMVQTDLKRMLAFSTVSQIGYMMMGIGIGTPLAITAGLLHCLNHGFFKGGLFLTAGSVQHAAGTRDMNKLGGLASKMPQTTLSWLIGVGSMMGIPLMSGFASKWMLYAAALQAGWAVPAMVAWAASLGTVFLGVKATSAVFLGPHDREHQRCARVSADDGLGHGLLAAGSVVLGVAPQLAVNYFLNPILWRSAWARACTSRGSASRPMRAASLQRAAWCWRWSHLSLAGAIYLVAYAASAVHPAARRWPARWRHLHRRRAAGEQGRLTAGDFSEIFQSTGTRSSAGRMSIAFILAFGADCRLSRARSARLRVDGASRDCFCWLLSSRRRFSLLARWDRARNSFRAPAGSDAGRADSPAFDLRHRHRAALFLAALTKPLGESFRVWP